MGRDPARIEDAQDLQAVLDVVVFDLILQWHHLLSDRISPTTLDGLRANVYWDGLFSLAMVGVMLVGRWQSGGR